MIIFLHIPKTAGSSFQFILNNNLGISHCHTNHTKKRIFTQSDLKFAKKVFPWLRGIAGHNLIDPLALAVSDPFYMTFLREPVARVLSAYQEQFMVNRRHGLPNCDFAEALRTQEKLENLHVKLMAGERNLDKAKRFLERCDFVGLTEKFDLSLHLLGKLYPKKLDLKYPMRRVATDNTIKKSVEKNSAFLEMARDYNRLDIELYSFAVNEIFPKLCEKAGLTVSSTIPSYVTKLRLPNLKDRLNRFYNLSVYRQLCKLRR
ncbi:MAG: sulfotransferase family 2 domain-containing protein [Limisphaerales bacterium]